MPIFTIIIFSIMTFANLSFACEGEYSNSCEAAHSCAWSSCKTYAEAAVELPITDEFSPEPSREGETQKETLWKNQSTFRERADKAAEFYNTVKIRSDHCTNLVYACQRECFKHSAQAGAANDEAAKIIAEERAEACSPNGEVYQIRESLQAAKTQAFQLKHSTQAQLDSATLLVPDDGQVQRVPSSPLVQSHPCDGVDGLCFGHNFEFKF